MSEITTREISIRGTIKKNYTIPETVKTREDLDKFIQDKFSSTDFLLTGTLHLDEVFYWNSDDEMWDIEAHIIKDAEDDICFCEGTE